MYEAITRGIRVRVSPEFKSEQSTPEENYYFWTYTVEIINEGAETMHLRSRKWEITDTRGHREEVRGPGVDWPNAATSRLASALATRRVVPCARRPALWSVATRWPIAHGYSCSISRFQRFPSTVPYRPTPL